MAAGHFLPNVGGIERYVYNLSKALVQQGAQVAVVASHFGETPLAEQLDGIDIIRLPSIQLGGGRLPVPNPFSPKLARQFDALREWAPDIFVVHTHLFFSNLCVAKFAQHLKKPYVLINHGSGYVSGGGPILDMGLRAYERFLAKRIARNRSAAFGVSASAAKWLGEFGIQTDAVIPNGVEISSMPARNPEVRKKLDIPEDHCLIAFAARLLPDKGADTLVSAFMTLDRPHASLVIAGDGPALTELKIQAAANRRVHFLGARSHSDVLNLFGSADIMAYPSRYPEGQPTTVLEAGAMGCAVIATPRGGTAELIDSPKLGIIVEDKAGLEDGLRLLLDDAQLRRELGQELQKKIRIQHDWKTIAHNASAVLASICEVPQVTKNP